MIGAARDALVGRANFKSGKFSEFSIQERGIFTALLVLLFQASELREKNRGLKFGDAIVAADNIMEVPRFAFAPAHIGKRSSEGCKLFVVGDHDAAFSRRD